MIVDIIDFCINCQNTSMSVCFGYTVAKCKYLDFCGSYHNNGFKMMIYSEGE